MNNYHLYEEIGSGKFSVVYKGRKRHTIHYVAIKSVEKCRRAKVMTEVNMLSRLQTHPNVLEFYFWNETRNHLWVINEYCCGGDLMQLLKQDVKLDEQQALKFGTDICEGLFFVHSRGIIYTDLKPSNVLFDETGRLKLSDFGMSILLSDLNKEDGTPVPRRGTPYYMSPELFLEDGIHSFSSDLWSLGIVLHEFVTGKPPFQPASFKELHSMILERKPPALAGVYTSPEYEHLVHSLLAKDPAYRADWQTIHEHAAWGEQRLPSQGHLHVLPPQEHFERWKRRGAATEQGETLKNEGEEKMLKKTEDGSGPGASSCAGVGGGAGETDVRAPMGAGESRSQTQEPKCVGGQSDRRGGDNSSQQRAGGGSSAQQGGGTTKGNQNNGQAGAGAATSVDTRETETARPPASGREEEASRGGGAAGVRPPRGSGSSASPALAPPPSAGQQGGGRAAGASAQGGGQQGSGSRTTAAGSKNMNSTTPTRPSASELAGTSSSRMEKRLDPLRLSAIAQKNLIQEEPSREPWDPGDLQLKGFDQHLNFEVEADDARKHPHATTAAGASDYSGASGLPTRPSSSFSTPAAVAVEQAQQAAPEDAGDRPKGGPKNSVISLQQPPFPMPTTGGQQPLLITPNGQNYHSGGSAPSSSRPRMKMTTATMVSVGGGEDATESTTSTTSSKQSSAKMLKTENPNSSPTTPSTSRPVSANNGLTLQDRKPTRRDLVGHHGQGRSKAAAGSTTSSGGSSNASSPDLVVGGSGRVGGSAASCTGTDDVSAGAATAPAQSKRGQQQQQQVQPASARQLSDGNTFTTRNIPNLPAPTTRNIATSSNGPPQHSNPTLTPTSPLSSRQQQNNVHLQQQPLCSTPISADVLQKCRSLLSHVETSVTPISNNTAIEQKYVPPPVPHASLLPFQSLALEDVFVCSNAELEQFLTKVYKCIAQGTVDTKIMTLIYLENLCGHMQVADLVVNSSLLKLVLKMVRVRSTELRVRLWTLIGQLLRHATFLEPSIAELGIFEALTEAVGEKDLTVQRKASAALGELLFYVATQPVGEGGVSPWRVPEATLRFVTHTIINDERRYDVVVAHYAVKTLENISTQSPVTAQKWFLNAHGGELAEALHAHVAAETEDENFRLTCLGALAMIARIAPAMAIRAMVLGEESSLSGSQSSSPGLLVNGSNGVNVAESTTSQSSSGRSGGGGATSSSVGSSQRDSLVGAIRYDFGCIFLGLNGSLSPRGVPAAFHLLLAVLLQRDVSVTLKQQRQDLEQIVGCLLQLSGQTRGHSVFRGKSILLLALLAFVDVHFLLLAFENHFGSHVEKICAREGQSARNAATTGTTGAGQQQQQVALKDRYVTQCLSMASALLANFANTFLGNLCAEMRRGDQRNTPHLLARKLHVPVYFLSCSLLRPCVLNAKSLPHLTNLVTTANASPQWRGTAAHRAALLVCENVSAQQVPLLLECLPATLKFLHAVGAILSPHSSEESLFLALRCFGDITVALLNEGVNYNSNKERQQEREELLGKELRGLLAERFFPKLPLLFQCGDPLPTVCIRLLSCILEGSYWGPRGLPAVEGMSLLGGIKETILQALSTQVVASVHGASLACSLLKLREVKAAQLGDVYVRLLDLISSRAEGSAARVDTAHLEAIVQLVELSLKDASRPPVLASLLCPLLSISSLYVQSAPSLVDRLIKVCEMLALMLGEMRSRGGGDHQHIKEFAPVKIPRARDVVRSLITLITSSAAGGGSAAAGTGSARLAKWLLENGEQLPNDLHQALLRVLR